MNYEEISQRLRILDDTDDLWVQQANTFSFDHLPNPALLDEVTKLAESCDTYPINIPTPKFKVSPNETHQETNLHPNVSAVQNPQPSTSNSRNSSKQNYLPLEYNNDRVDLLPNSIYFHYFKDGQNSPTEFEKIVATHLINGLHQEAIDACKDEIDKLRIGKVMDDYPISHVLNILAVIHSRVNNFGEAIPLLHEVIEIRVRERGKDHLSVAAILNNVSVLHGKCGNYAKAESFCRESLEMKRKNFGFLHPEVGKQYYNLGALEHAQGKYGLASTNYKTARQIFEKQLGLNNQFTKRARDNSILCSRKHADMKSVGDIL